jgi:hypothetical protein
MYRQTEVEIIIYVQVRLVDLLFSFTVFMSCYSIDELEIVIW